MFTFDHIAVAGETLDDAVAHSEAALGFALGPGGQHPYYATHNRLVGLADGLYFEAIAPDPSQIKPSYPRWFGLDAFKGPARLDKWILRCDDIEAAHAAFPEIGEPVRLTRGKVSWTMIVPKDGMLPFDGCFPAFIEWHVDAPPGKSLPRTDRRLTELRVSHPQADQIEARLAGAFDDSRVMFEISDATGLLAQFETPEGPRLLR